MAHLIIPIVCFLMVTSKTLAIVGQQNNEVVLLTGGWPHRKSVEVFGSLGSQPWCSPSLSLPDSLGRFSHTSHYVNGKVLICGGQYISNTTLELVNGEFKPHSYLNEHRHGHSGVVLWNQLSLLGGDRKPESMETLQENTWIKRKNMKHSVLDSCVVALQDAAMVIGGVGNPFAVSLYDGEGGWYEKRSLTGRRYGHSCVALGRDEVLVAGGSDGGSFLSSAIKITNNGDSWEELPGRMNIARGWGQMVNMNGRILYFGGVDGQYKDLDTVEEFDVDTGTWRLLPQTMSTPRGYLSAVTVPASAVGC